MAAPRRGNTGFSTYFITAATFQKHSLFQSGRMADLFVQVLLSYKSQHKYLLHEFVLMPDHLHLLWVLKKSVNRRHFACDSIPAESFFSLLSVRLGGGWQRLCCRLAEEPY